MCKSHIEASVYLNKRVIYSNNDTNIRLTIDIKQKANRTKLESNKDKDSQRYQLISNNAVYKAQTYFDNNISYGLYSRYNLTSYSNTTFQIFLQLSLINNSLGKNTLNICSSFIFLQTYYKLILNRQYIHTYTYITHRFMC